MVVMKALGLGILVCLVMTPCMGEGRTPWTLSRFVGSPEKPRPFVLERQFSHLSFTRPVDLVYEATSDRYFMVELDGRISSFANDPRAKSASLAIDLKKHYPKLVHAYSLVFHPKFKQNRFVYVCYIAERNHPTGTHISRFKVTNTNPPRIDPDSEQLLLTWRSGGHNGCKLLFGSDGMLYFSSGDATQPSPPDTLKTGQDISDLLSSVMRIDVDRREGERHYAIPHDNPFVNHKGARPEVWAYGLRNPWRMSFDADAGDLWVGDVGWELWELVFRVERGGNYGWSIVEGSQPVRPNGKRGPTPIQPPVMQHPHTEAMSITGGYVYRGHRLASLRGQYVYGDYITGKMWALPAARDAAAKPTEIADTGIQIITFAETPDRDLLVVDYAGGMYLLTANPNANRSDDFPTKLSESGLFATTKTHRLAEGVERYHVHAPLWADHAIAERAIAMPGQARIDYFDKNNGYKGWYRGRWKYPAGTVFAKTYAMEMVAGDPLSRRLLETQILHLDDETWRGYTYIWNENQSDATLAPAQGAELELKVKDPQAPNGVRQQTWRVASRTECMTCHNAKSGIILGFTPEQLNGGQATNELKRLEERGLFNSPPKWAANIKPRPTLVNPHAPHGDLTARARAWLHTNCAHCHQQGGGGTTTIDLRHHRPLRQAGLLNAEPLQGGFGLDKARIVSPGDPYRSVLWYRVATTGAGHMPRIGAKHVDADGFRLIHDWIAAMPTDSPIKAIEQLSDDAVDSHLNFTTGALHLLYAMEADDVDHDLRKRVIERGALHGDSRISGLFERFVPVDRRRQALGAQFNMSDVLALSGDPKRGSRILQSGGAVTCLSCHQVNGQGRHVGPDLSAIGSQYKRSELLTHIVKPSLKIDEKYRPYFVSTSDGDDLTGFIVAKDDAKLTLNLFTGAAVTVSVKDIVEMRKLQTSSMPANLLQALTAQEAADLIDFLASLKTAGKTSAKQSPSP